MSTPKSQGIWSDVRALTEKTGVAKLGEAGIKPGAYVVFLSGDRLLAGVILKMEPKQADVDVVHVNAEIQHLDSPQRISQVRDANHVFAVSQNTLRELDALASSGKEGGK